MTAGAGARKPVVIREDVPHADRELIAEFIAQSPHGESTRVRYATQLGEFAAWLAHERTKRRERSGGLTSVVRADVVRFKAYLASGNRYAASPTVRDRTRVLGASAVKNHVCAVQGLFKYLVVVEIVDRNPAEGVDRPRVKVRPGLLLSREEVRAFLDARGRPREDVAAYVLAFTAVRLDSLRVMRWCDVDLDAGTVAIKAKRDKHLVLDLHPELRAELRRYRLHMLELADRKVEIRAALANPETAYLLLTRNGRPFTKRSLYAMVKRRATRAGLYVEEPKHGECRSRVSPHVLRRTFATLQLNDGQPLDAVADVLGHESVDTTRKHYAFSSNERRRATIMSYSI
ncbi:MAG: tyrosine-type recombinase/integrase [Thermoleophilia bacterium]|nr:tyrosine-type recombinase/integrase [Thermoleophilia bacterium]